MWEYVIIRVESADGFGRIPGSKRKPMERQRNELRRLVTGEQALGI